MPHAAPIAGSSAREDKQEISRRSRYDHGNGREMPTDADKKGAQSAETREILVPYDPAAGPVTAVRNVIIQESLNQLRTNQHFERYAKLIAADVLEQLIDLSLAPGWIPIELALAHYEACDNLMLTSEQFAVMGYAVGERVHGTMLVSSAKKARDPGYDPWSAEGALQRMWPRLFQGGSVQVVKLGPKAKLMEERGFRLNRYHYYRQAHLAAVMSTHSSLGIHDVQTKVESYSPARDELVVRVSWT